MGNCFDNYAGDFEPDYVDHRTVRLELSFIVEQGAEVLNTLSDKLNS